MKNSVSSAAAGLVRVCSCITSMALPGTFCSTALPVFFVGPMYYMRCLVTGLTSVTPLNTVNISVACSANALSEDLVAVACVIEYPVLGSFGLHTMCQHSNRY